MKILFGLFIFSIVSISLSFGQNPSPSYTVSGYIKEKGSGELLVGASVFSPKYERGGVANNYGFYSMKFPASDTLVLLFSLFGYNSETKVINLNKDIELNISLGTDTVVFEEVIIETNDYKKSSDNAKISSIEVPVQQIKEIPSLLGEKDVFKVLQLMPGVKKGSEGNSGLYVRGGGPDQNLIILDDATVYNAYHLFGFFSVFNGDAIKSVELMKGGFPARYGGRLSSVVEMNMKEGNKEKIHGEAGIGLLSSRLTVEGPLKKGKSSFLISGRRTYFDLLTYPLMPKDEKAGYNFHDLNMKVNYDFGQKNKLYLSSYIGRDKFFARYAGDDYKSEAGLGWSNATATARWNHLFSNNVFANTSLIFSNYVFKIYENEKDLSHDDEYNLKYYSGIRDFSLKHDIDYMPGLKHTFKFGAIVTSHTFTPGALVYKDTYANTTDKIGKSSYALESGIYVENVYKPNAKLTINSGFRISQFLTGGINYLNPEPRLSIGYKLKEDMALKAGYSVMNQYIHLLSNTGIGLPTDLWVPSTKNVKPQNAQQIAAGFVKDFIKQKTTLTIEGYYKKTKRILNYKEGASFLLLDDPSSGQGVSWEQNVTPGQGWAYGVEFLLQKKIGKFSGWVGYTLSWTQLQFDSLNNGEKFYSKYDRRHDVSLVGIYRISENVTLSGTWVYGTGNAINMPLAQYSLTTHNPGQDKYYTMYNYRDITDYGKRNSSRMPAYHRLDIGIQFHKDLSWGGRRTWEISVYNVYSKKNPYFYFLDQKLVNSSQHINQLQQISLFPIIPSFSYQLKF